MKTAISIFAAGLMSAGAAHAQGVNQTKPMPQPAAPMGGVMSQPASVQPPALPPAQQDALGKLQLAEMQALQAILTSPQPPQPQQIAALQTLQQQQFQLSPPTPQQLQARQQLSLLLQQAQLQNKPMTPQLAQQASVWLQQGQGAKTQIGGVALPQMPANLMDPGAATQATSDIFAFMALFQKMAQQMRDQARSERNAQMDAQVQSLQDAAEKMKQAAAANLQAAQINGAMAIASGAVQMGAAGASSLKAGASQGKSTAQPGISSGAGATGQLMAPTKPLTPQEKQQGIGAIANAQQVFNANMAAAEADKKKAEAQAQAASASQSSQQSQQMMQQMQDMIRDIQQKLQAIQQSQVETTKAITRN